MHMKYEYFLIDEKPLTWFSVFFALFAVGAMACIPLRGWDPQATFNVAGILCVLTGTILLAGGVKLSRSEIEFLALKIEKKDKHIKKIGGMLVAASKVVNFGLAYILLGSILQVISTILNKVELPPFLL